jgi:hypothetical protein
VNDLLVMSRFACAIHGKMSRLLGESRYARARIVGVATHRLSATPLTPDVATTSSAFGVTAGILCERHRNKCPISLRQISFSFFSALPQHICVA